tara:strand:+ start:1529 stop:2251 length:723 start_codon:yes stop_codon:yes gene_type:complete
MKKIYFLLLLVTTFSFSAQVTITHRVDITDYLAGGATLDATGIRIAGNFADNGANLAGTSMVNWTPTDAVGAMIDLGNNIWEITIDYPNPGGTVYYKFVNGDWGADESVSDTTCGGGGGFGTDRILEIPTSNTGFTYCWASCAQCDSSAANIIESNFTNISVSPNPSENYTIFNFDVKKSSKISLSIYDITGKLVDNVINKLIFNGAQSIEYNSSFLNSGVYIYKINSNNEDITGKLIVK